MLGFRARRYACGVDLPCAPEILQHPVFSDRSGRLPTPCHPGPNQESRPHIRRVGEEKLDQSAKNTLRARRWVVDRALAWLTKCRATLVRDDKTLSNYLSLVQLACALIRYRRQWRMCKMAYAYYESFSNEGEDYANKVLDDHGGRVGNLGRGVCDWAHRRGRDPHLPRTTAGSHSCACRPSRTPWRTGASRGTWRTGASGRCRPSRPPW